MDYPAETNQEPHKSIPAPWASPGPEKELWKADGNRYLPEELLRMERAGGMIVQDWDVLKP